MRRVVLTLGCAVLLALPACSGKDKAEDTAAPETSQVVAAAPEEKPVEALYNDAAALLDKNQYQSAAKAFDNVERQYPYSPWATRAQLMSAYSYYRDLKYDEAILGLDRFIQLHPGNENIAYATYLRALSYYEQISDVRRDQKMTQLALDTLTQVVTRFPESRYARDASLKIDLTLDYLAGKEMEIGRYYLKKGEYHAAINRFQAVVIDYQTTTHVPEALHRLTESYLALGIPSEAEKTAAVLGHNYPDSNWYEDSYKILRGTRPPKDSAGDTGQAEQNIFGRTLDRIF